LLKRFCGQIRSDPKSPQHLHFFWELLGAFFALGSSGCLGKNNRFRIAITPLFGLLFRPFHFHVFYPFISTAQENYDSR
jgi:hypothetical protein